LILIVFLPGRFHLFLVCLIDVKALRKLYRLPLFNAFLPKGDLASLSDLLFRARTVEARGDLVFFSDLL